MVWYNIDLSGRFWLGVACDRAMCVCGISVFGFSGFRVVSIGGCGFRGLLTSGVAVAGVLFVGWCGFF